MEIGMNAETVAGGGIISVIGLATLRKLYIDWMKQRPEVASASAVEAQFKALRDQIAAQQIEIKELRTEVTRMDVTIHRQQTKLTRTEMLLRQFVGLVQQHGTPVPPYMQAEVDDLLNQDAAA